MRVVSTFALYLIGAVCADQPAQGKGIRKRVVYTVDSAEQNNRDLAGVQWVITNINRTPQTLTARQKGDAKDPKGDDAPKGEEDYFESWT